MTVTGRMGATMTEGQLAAIEERLQNWGRWAFGTIGGGKGHCASVEYRYVPEKLGEGEQAVHRTAMTVDVLDAETVERAVTSLQCRVARRFLIKAYVFRASRVTLSQMFRIQGALYDAYRLRVAKLVADTLQDQDRRHVRRGKPLWAGVARTTKARV